MMASKQTISTALELGRVICSVVEHSSHGSLAATIRSAGVSPERFEALKMARARMTLVDIVGLAKAVGKSPDLLIKDAYRLVIRAQS